MSPIQIPFNALTSQFGDRFNSIRSQSFGSRFANLRPVSEFLDVKRISKPANFGEVQSRVNYNLSYFSSNYAVVFVMLSIYSLLTNLTLLFVILLAFGGVYGIGKLGGRDLDVGFARFNTSQLYTTLLCITVPLGLGGGLGGRPRAPYGTPRWGRPPGAQLGRQTRRQTRRRVGLRAENDPQVEEIDSDEEDQFVLRDDRTAYARQLASQHLDGGNGWRRRMLGYDEHADSPGLEDAADYDLYEDTDSTVAYAIQLAMKDKEEWLVDKALERIRRAQSHGQANVRLSKRELDALERKRLQTGRTNDSERRNGTPKTVPPDNRRSRVPGNPINGAASRRNGSVLSSNKPNPPYPLADPSLYEVWARTTSSALGNQSPASPHSAASLRSPLQPPFAPEHHYATPIYPSPTAFPKPAFHRPYHHDAPWMAPYPVPFTRDQTAYMPGYPPVIDERLPASPQASTTPPQEPAEPAPAPTATADESKERKSGSGDDDVHIVEVVERKVPSTPTRTAAGRGSRQRSHG